MRRFNARLPNPRLAVGVLALFLVAGTAPAQPTTSPKDAGKAADASQWRHAPKAPPPPENDAASPEARAARDRFFDSSSRAKGPLDTPAGEGATFVHEQVGNGPEIPLSDVIAAVTFDDYQPYLTLSRRSIYTEIRLRTERVLKGRAGYAGSTPLTLILPGGTVRTTSGIISYGHLDSAFQLQPGHRYVVFLEHIESGDFYILDKSWELRDGAAQPNAPDDLMRANHGTSLYAGMREEEFLALIPH